MYQQYKWWTISRHCRCRWYRSTPKHRTCTSNDAGALSSPSPSSPSSLSKFKMYIGSCHFNGKNVKSNKFLQSILKELNYATKWTSTRPWTSLDVDYVASLYCTDKDEGMLDELLKSILRWSSRTIRPIFHSPLAGFPDTERPTVCNSVNGIVLWAIYKWWW